MFNQNSAQSEQTAGQSEIREARAPIVSVMDQSNTETPEPSVKPGETGLAWWDAMKYYWRQNSSGRGSHLAPQDSYVDDVLSEGDIEIQTAAKDFLDEKSDDLRLANEELAAATSILETRTGFDPSGVEANAFARLYRDRAIIARKICGASIVSANHRLQNAAATTGDTDAVVDSDFFKSDIENAKRWAFKACYYEYIVSKLHEVFDMKEVLPKGLAQALADGVRRQLYDDAVERGNKLKRPAPATQPNANKLSAEELRQLRA